MTIGERLQEAIARRHTTQSEVAASAGISRQQIHRIISGANLNPGILLVEKIAEAIGMTMAELYRDIE